LLTYLNVCCAAMLKHQSIPTQASDMEAAPLLPQASISIAAHILKRMLRCDAQTSKHTDSG
ncbi:hypothetical protein, partial [Legionella sp. 29fVS95]|uniref:hypothetical protein n=1 Tax=Legionella sp. 29fVS95 TaxID=3402813 RepID=UPI003AF6391C